MDERTREAEMAGSWMSWLKLSPAPSTLVSLEKVIWSVETSDTEAWRNAAIKLKTAALGRNGGNQRSEEKRNSVFVHVELINDAMTWWTEKVCWHRCAVA